MDEVFGRAFLLPGLLSEILEARGVPDVSVTGKVLLERQGELRVADFAFNGYGGTRKDPRVTPRVVPVPDLSGWSFVFERFAREFPESPGMAAYVAWARSPEGKEGVFTFDCEKTTEEKDMPRALFRDLFFNMADCNFGEWCDNMVGYEAEPGGDEYDWLHKVYEREVRNVTAIETVFGSMDTFKDFMAQAENATSAPSPGAG